MKTVFGIVADELGLASTTDLVQGPDRPELRYRTWASPASEIRVEQPDRIPIDLDHGPVVGEVVYLERHAGNLWAIGHIDDSVIPAVNVKVGDTWVCLEHNLYWSGSRLSTPDYEDIIIDSIALTAHPARISARPVTLLPGKLDHRQAPDRWRDTLNSHERGLLERAAGYHLDRRDTRWRERQAGRPLHQRPRDLPLRVCEAPRDLVIERVAPNAFLVDDELVTSRSASVELPDNDGRPPGRMIHRPGGYVIGVR